MQQVHLENKTQAQSDYEMFIPAEIGPNEVAYVKILATSEPNSNKQDPKESNRTLTIDGFSEHGDILFNYENKEQELTQHFGFSLKYYRAH